MSEFNEYNEIQKPNGESGKIAAIACLACGIVSVVSLLFLVLFFESINISISIFAFLSLIVGIVGIGCASSAKKAGYVGGIQTAGFVLSIIGTCLGGLVALAYVSCAACFGVMEDFSGL